MVCIYFIHIEPPYFALFSMSGSCCSVNFRDLTFDYFLDFPLTNPPPKCQLRVQLRVKLSGVNGKINPP